MTDEELITRLRDLGLNSPNIAADRIEQLLKDAEVANDAIDHWIVAYNNLEAKLAKAVDVIKHIINIAPEGYLQDTADALLAELEKPE